MKIAIIEYDQESGHEGIHALADKFAEGWETLTPLCYHECCGIYRTVLYFPEQPITQE